MRFKAEKLLALDTGIVKNIFRAVLTLGKDELDVSDDHFSQNRFCPMTFGRFRLNMTHSLSKSVHEN